MTNKQLVINETLHKEIKILAAEKGISIKSFIEFAINRLIKKYHEQKEKELEN